MSIPAIELDNLQKIYRDKRFRAVTALGGVSLRVDPGEAFGFVGPNGAGKSTTIKILTGILRPSGGEALIQGMDVQDHRARRQLGYVPENPYL